MTRSLHVLFGRHGLELDRLIRVLSPARRTSAIEILLNVVPAESTDLVSTGAWFEVGVRDINLFQTERTLHFILLVSMREPVAQA